MAKKATGAAFGAARALDAVRARRGSGAAASGNVTGKGLKVNAGGQHSLFAGSLFYFDSQGRLQFRDPGAPLSIQPGSPERLVLNLGSGFTVDPKGKLAPRISSSVKVNASGQLIATPTTAEVIDADNPDETAVQALARKANVATVTALDATVAAIDSRVTALEAIGNTVVAWFHAVSSAQSTWANMPAAATLLNGHHRHIARLDLTDYTQARLHVNKMGTAGFAGSKFVLRYRTSFSTTAADYSDAGTSEVSCAIDATDTFLSSAWVDLAEAAKADVFLAIVGEGGDGAVDPQYGGIYAEFR